MAVPPFGTRVRAKPQLWDYRVEPRPESLPERPAGDSGSSPLYRNVPGTVEGTLINIPSPWAPGEPGYSVALDDGTVIDVDKDSIKEVAPTNEPIMDMVPTTEQEA